MFQEPVRRMANRFDHFASLQVKDVTVLHVAHDNAASCPRNSSDRPHVAAVLGPLIRINPPINIIVSNSLISKRFTIVSTYFCQGQSSRYW